ncbi:MAG: ABC transporter permease [Vicinamibacterales bacterium]
MFIDDLRHAFRRLRSRPAMALAAAGMLALAIGLTTAMFTIVDSLLLRPVPFPQADRLAQLKMRSRNTVRGVVSARVLEAWRDAPVLDAVEGVATDTVLIETDAGLVAREGAFVTPGMLDMLGARALRGRLFLAGEGRAGTDGVVILSEGIWRSLYGADPAIVGRAIAIDGAQATIVGVLPFKFRFPGWNTAIWKPLDFSAPPAPQAGRLPQVFGRFVQGISRADAGRTIGASSDPAGATYPEQVLTQMARAADPAYEKNWAYIDTLAGPRTSDYIYRATPILAGGVALVFLVLCANVSSLLLARLTARGREFSVCAALGASRARLLREALVESVSLGAAGMLLGLALAAGLVQIARALLPEAFLLQTLNPVDINVRALAVASLAGLLATVAAGLLPAWLGTRAEPANALRATERGGTETRSVRSLTRTLLIGEVALACTLLVGATLLVRSFVNLAGADRGLDARGVLTAWVSGLPGSAEDRTVRENAARIIEDAVHAIPGVQQVVLSHAVPPDGGGVSFGDDWLSDVPGAGPKDITANRYWVGADFFEFYGIPLLRGRTFRPDDPDDVVIVGERFAALMWPGLDPVGRSFRFGKEAFRVIGLARETNLPAVNPFDDRSEFYEPFARGGGGFRMSIRCGNACPDEAIVRRAITGASAGARVIQVQVLENVYLQQTSRPRAAAALAFAFAAIAVLAVAGGLFAVLSYAVGRRRREFGIRLALGARPGEVRRLVFGDGLRVAVIGLALGGLAAWWLSQSLATMTYGVATGDISIWLTVAAVIALTTMLASWRPAARAAKVDPVALLREE